MILYLEYYVYVNNVIFFFKKMLGNVKKILYVYVWISGKLFIKRNNDIFRIRLLMYGVVC